MKKEDLKKLREKFLNEKEDNFNIIPTYIKKMHSELLNKSCGAYIGDLDFKKESLKDFEEIPYKGLDTENVMKGIKKALEGQIIWNSQNVLHNINPPVTLESIIASSMANIYNPNSLWDFVSSGSQEMEKQVVRQISKLIGWNVEKSDGVFTFGGKGCLTYAIKLGLNRVLSGNAKKGIYSTAHTSPIVIASEESHYSIDTVCSLLGIGTDNCIRVKVNKYGEMDIEDFERIFNWAINNKIPIASIIINGSNTLNNSVDNIKKVKKIINSKKEKLIYSPYIHFDMVIGWSWLFFKDYDYNKNELQIDKKALQKIKKLTSKIQNCKLADSVGIDFHKTGFTPYISSLFVVKKKEELHSIFKEEVRETKRNDFGNNFLQHHTIEHSRTSASIFSAWTVLQGIGIEGFRIYIANLISVANIFRKTLPHYEFECLNDFSLSFATAFFPNYRGKKYKEIFISNDKKEINKINNYVYALFNYIAKGKHQFNKYVLGYLPKYEQNKFGYDISGIRIFPMSVHIDEENVERICKELFEIKKQFDSIYDFEYSKEEENKPKHVPK